MRFRPTVSLHEHCMHASSCSPPHSFAACLCVLAVCTRLFCHASILICYFLNFILLDSRHQCAGLFCCGSHQLFWRLAGVEMNGRRPLLLWPLSVVSASSEDLYLVGLYGNTQEIASSVACEYFIILDCEVGQGAPL